MSGASFDSLPRYPSDEQITEDLCVIHNEDALFSNEVKQMIGIVEIKEESKTDFDKIKELIITNQNLKDFLTEFEIEFKSNINTKYSELKTVAQDLKQLSEKATSQHFC